MIARSDNTSRSAIIRGGIFAVALLAAVIFTSTVALAATGWNNPVKLYTVLYDDSSVVDLNAWIELTPQYTVVGNYFVYTYELSNSNAPETITSFALTFTDVLNSNIQFTDFQPLTGWGNYDSGHYVGGTPSVMNFATGRELLWNAPDGGGIKPGDSVTFGFTTTLNPGNLRDNKTSGMGLARGYNGYTYGPVIVSSGGPAPISVPELPSVFLGLSGLGFVQVIRTRLTGIIKRRSC